MNLKKIKIINVIGVFALSFLFHFMYEWWPNVVTSIFFPVNESIWEHMKIFVSAILVWGLVDKFLLNKFNIYYNNHFFSTVLTSILSIALYLTIYLPLYKIFGEIMFISIGLMLLVYAFMAYVSYKILSGRELNINKVFLIIVIIVTYVSFGLLTYKPPKYFLFYDTNLKKYGI